MAGTRITMSSLKQVLLLRNLGTGKKKIAEATGVSKATIAAYLELINRKGYILKDLVMMEEPLLETLFMEARESQEIQRLDDLQHVPVFNGRTSPRGG